MNNNYMLHDYTFRTKLDARADAYNKLSDQIAEANIDLSLLKKFNLCN